MKTPIYVVHPFLSLRKTRHLHKMPAMCPKDARVSRPIPPVPGQNREESLPVVDEAGRFIRLEKRHVIHTQGLLHQAVHGFIFEAAGRMLLQQRAPGKDSWPGYWDCSVGGHLDAGEDFEQALLRETREELGLTDVQWRFARALPPSRETGWEHVWEYCGRIPADAELHPAPAEVSDWDWVSPGAVLAEAVAGSRPCTPGLLDFLRWHGANKAE